jgi:transcriptional regulator with XRE-family HTH domain
VRRRTPATEAGTALRSAFARNLRQFRQKQGMTQEDLANAAGLGRPFINQIERGRFSVTLETVGALSEALQVEPGALISPIN